MDTLDYLLRLRQISIVVSMSGSREPQRYMLRHKGRLASHNSSEWTRRLMLQPEGKSPYAAWTKVGFRVRGRGWLARGQDTGHVRRRRLSGGLHGTQATVTSRFLLLIDDGGVHGRDALPRRCLRRRLFSLPAARGYTRINGGWHSRRHGMRGATHRHPRQRRYPCRHDPPPLLSRVRLGTRVGQLAPSSYAREVEQ